MPAVLVDLDGASGRLVAVIDGDTFTVAAPSGEVTVRIVGIDAPEFDDVGQRDLAEQAREALRTLIGDGPLRLIADAEPADAGGRLLRHVYRADRLLAADLARQGWVRALPIPPNLAEREVIDRAVAEARAAARGIWALDVGGVSLSVDKVKEVVTLANTGSAPLDISGWWLVSLRGKQSYRFPTQTTITPGEDPSGRVRGDPGHASIPAAQRLEQHQTQTQPNCVAPTDASSAFGTTPLRPRGRGRSRGPALVPGQGS